MKKMTIAVVLIGIAMVAWFVFSDKKSETTEHGEAPVELIWYQVGDAQKDTELVLEQVNAYIGEKLGVKLKIMNISLSDYNQKMQVVMNTGSPWDLCFTSSWTNDYLQNVNKGVFLALDELLEDTQMYGNIDERFWEAARVKGHIYGVPSEKELGNMPMWVFTKEYVDKYDIPYDTIHTLEDLEPWLALIKENEADVTPLYVTRDYTAPTYMDKIADPVGIEYGDETLKVQNVFETQRMQQTLATMRSYYVAGYVNQDAATATDDKTRRRFVTKGDGQPFAEQIWGKELGYEVVVSPIMDTSITNASARGAITAVNAESDHPKEAIALLDLINTDEYLRNLLNYGIEGVHWERVEVSQQEAANAEGKPYVYNTKVHLIEDRFRDYSVLYWVQGGLFNTYVMENESVDKWSVFKEFNDASEEAPSFGFDFDVAPVSGQVASFRTILDEFGKALYTGSVDPDVYLPKLIARLEDAGIDQVIEEMQSQVDQWQKDSAISAQP